MVIDEMDRLLKALDTLFEDPGIHPVVVRRSTSSNPIPVPTIDEGMHRCHHCTDRLLELSDAYYAYKSPSKK